MANPGTDRTRCHVLATGPSGVGKSFFARTLNRLGYATYVSDEISGLAAWHDADGRAIAAPDALDEGFLHSHRFLWDERRLREWLGEHPVAVVFGISHNSTSLGGLFDFVVLLEAEVEEILRNLAQEDRSNAFGQAYLHQELARQDTADYYRHAPADWVRMANRDPEALVRKWNLDGQAAAPGGAGNRLWSCASQAAGSTVTR